jgi:hypothetical protein
MFQSDQVTVGGTAVESTANFDTDQEYELWIRVDANVQLWIGDSALDPATNGWPLPTGTTVVRSKGDKVYANVTTATPAVIFLLTMSN